MRGFRCEVIPHAQQRLQLEYGPGNQEPCDWQFIDGELVIKVSDMGNWQYNFLAAAHELVEAVLCHARGITDGDVDKFDQSWTEHDGLDGPGDDPTAPYYREHRVADVVERLLAFCLGVTWTDYEDAMEALAETGGA